MIKDQVQKQIIDAMKSGDKVRVSTLKLLSSAFYNAKIDKRDELTEEEELEIVRSEAKKRKDAIEAYENAGRKDSSQAEKQELEILQEFLPTNLTENEIESLVEEAIEKLNASSADELGKIMGYVMSKAQGRADGNEVKKIVEAKLHA